MVRTALRGTGQTLITVGLVILLFSVWELYGTNLYTNKQQKTLTNELEDHCAHPSILPTGQPELVSVQLGKGLPNLGIPRLGEKYTKVIVEGVGHEDLKKGPGHYPGTALPGQLGNFVVSGHRTTYGAPFNHLDWMKPGDAVVVETRTTWFVYRATKKE